MKNYIARLIILSFVAIAILSIAAFITRSSALVAADFCAISVFLTSVSTLDKIKGE